MSRKGTNVNLILALDDEVKSPNSVGSVQNSNESSVYSYFETIFWLFMLYLINVFVISAKKSTVFSSFLCNLMF